MQVRNCVNSGNACVKSARECILFVFCSSNRPCHARKEHTHQRKREREREVSDVDNWKEIGYSRDVVFYFTFIELIPSLKHFSARDGSLLTVT